MHHAFQPGRLLEDSLGVVLVLWVHKVRHDPLRTVQNFVVGVQFEDDLIDVAGKGGVASRIVDVAILEFLCGT